IPVTIQPSGQRAMLMGDNTAFPPVEFLEAPEQVRPGDRVISSGDGGVFPAGLLVGEVERTDGRLKVRLSADYQRLNFLRVLRSRPAEEISEAGGLVVAPAAASATGEAVAPEAPVTAGAENGAGDG
ncbi:MAG: rod shape-determining protein MreC, partial [Rhodobacteraceae bacterium]|nr:rod shape-determining protein MreC [Paracoccaceae bacterium]